MRHGVFRHRLCEMATDAVRGLVLEVRLEPVFWLLRFVSNLASILQALGYDVDIFEFIGGEHTDKNVMIVAKKKKKRKGGGRGRGEMELKREIEGVLEGVGVKEGTMGLVKWAGLGAKGNGEEEWEARIRKGRMPPI